jgi:hypothetical protein
MLHYQHDVPSAAFAPSALDKREGESWDDYKTRYIGAIDVRTRVGEVQWDRPNLVGGYYIDPFALEHELPFGINNVANNFYDPNKRYSRKEFGDRGLGVATLRLSGRFNLDLHQFRDYLRLWILHELDEWLHVEGTKPFNPHLDDGAQDGADLETVEAKYREFEPARKEWAGLSPIIDQEAPTP